MSEFSSVHFVTALPSEAKPLIEHFHLTLAPEAGFYKIYESPGIRLVISGVGKVRSAAATEFLYTAAKAAASSRPLTDSAQNRNVIWLNVGLAGHRDFEIGKAVLAHKITDRSTGESRYPPLLFKAPCATASLLTVDRPETRFSEPFAYEMEASGFYEAAARFSTAELVHSFKIISDNCATGPKVSASAAERLIGNHLPTVENLLQSLRSLSRNLPARFRIEGEFRRITKRWHFTVTERYRLRRLLGRLKTLAPGDKILDGDLECLRSARDVLHALGERINEAPVRL